jgi:uncharacterized protein YecT (DUF1311 family)
MPSPEIRPSIFRKHAIVQSAVLVFLLAAANVAAPAQIACGSPTDDTAPALDKLLANDPTCAKAHARLMACAWGSSADDQFAAIVIRKCEQTFLSSLSPQEKSRCSDERQLCTYEYARQEGTLYISEAAQCRADAAANFSAHPELARQPFPRASFDCNKATTPLEKAICSDAKLGRADIVLGRAYSSAFKEAPARERSTLIASERKWLKSIPAKCSLSASSPSATTIVCLRSAFELRFTALDGCSVSDEGIAACADTPDDDDAAPPPSPAP